MAELKELKAKLYDQFKSSQIESSLKAQLRIQLIQLFKAHSAGTNSKEKTLFETAVSSLIIDHLQCNNFSYSLSVFLPEFGIQLANVLGREDILKVLNIRNNAKLFNSLAQSDSRVGLLSQLLQELQKDQVVLIMFII
jgi:hypothetical protein